MICSVSRDYFQIIYNRLNIKLDEYGESYYNKFIPDVIKELENKGMIVEDSTVTKKGVKKEEKKEDKKGGKKDKKETKVEEK